MTDNLNEKDENDVRSKHYLFIFERPSANLYYKKSLAEGNTYYMYQNYGLEGMYLLGAGHASAAIFAVCFLVGTVLAVVLGNIIIVRYIGLALFGVGICIIPLMIFRLQQASRLGKVFRGDRPFINPKRM